MNKFKLSGGFNVSVSPAAVVMWCGMLSRGVWMPIVCAAVHEFGHLVALCLTGTRIGRMRVDVLGADIRYGDCRSYGAEFAACVAGAGANLTFAAFCLLLAMPEIAATNLGLALFNLIPARPLDGGAAVYALICRTSGMETADTVSRILNKSVAVIFGIAAGWLLFYGVGGWLWVAAAAMCAVIWGS